MNRFTSRTTRELITLHGVKETQQARKHSARREVALRKISAELATRFDGPEDAEEWNRLNN